MTKNNHYNLPCSDLNGLMPATPRIAHTTSAIKTKNPIFKIMSNIGVMYNNQETRATIAPITRMYFIVITSS